MTSTLVKDEASTMQALDGVLAETEKRKSKLSDVRQTCKQTELDIKSECQKLRDVIDLQEKKLLEELESVADKEIRQLEDDIKTKEMRVQMYQQSEVIKKCMNSDWETELCENYTSCETGLRHLEDDGCIDPPKGIIDGISFRKNTEQLIKDINGLQLSGTKVTQKDTLNLTFTPVSQATIDVRVEGDQDEPYPEDVIVLDVDGTNTVVVTDYSNNKSVKSFYSRNSRPCYSKLSLDGGPWGLTQLTRNLVAVTVPDRKQIITVDVSPDLKLVSTITTQKKYLGITALTKSTVAVGNPDPPSVDILDMTGTVIRSIIPTVNDENLLKYPSFFCTTKSGNILVSDSAARTVLCLTQQGDMVFIHPMREDETKEDEEGFTCRTEEDVNQRVRNPTGIIITDTGDILVADWSLHAVLHLTELGQYVANILTLYDGISHPHGLALDKNGRLYVCQPDGRLKVFKL